MLTLEERRESFVEDALPHVAGTDYGDGKRVIARIGLGMGFDQGYIFAIEKACEWLKNNKDSDYINDEPCQFGGRAELDDLFIEEFRKAMEE